nr:suppressor protein SRP40-like [Penaeus vannamei]
MTKCWTGILLVMLAILMQSGRATKLANSPGVSSIELDSRSESAEQFEDGATSSTSSSVSPSESSDSSSSSVTPSATSDSSSSSVTPSASPDSSSSSVTPSASSDSSSSSVTPTEPNTSSDSTNPVSSTTDTTDKPTLTGKELFIRTEEVLGDIDQSLNILQELFLELREKLHSGPLHHIRSKVNRSFSRKDVETKTDICITDSGTCNTIEELLLRISKQTNDLTANPEAWGDSQLSQLEIQSNDLTEAVKNPNKDHFKEEETKTRINEVKGEVSEGRRVASEQVKSFEAAERDSVIFTSVLGTVGGLMVVGLLGAVIFAVSKGKKVSKKPGKKGYNQVPEERIPVGDFIRAHDNPPPTRSSPEARKDPDARDEYATPYAPAAPVNRDPYARGRSPGEARSHYSQGRSGGLPRRY